MHLVVLFFISNVRMTIALYFSCFCSSSHYDFSHTSTNANTYHTYRNTNNTCTAYATEFVAKFSQLVISRSNERRAFSSTSHLALRSPSSSSKLHLCCYTFRRRHSCSSQRFYRLCTQSRSLV